MSNAKRKPIESADLFKPVGLLVIGPWAIWCARPKPERRNPRRSRAKQLRLDLDTPIHSKKDTSL